MLPQSGGRPDPLKLPELRANAKVLARNLQNELDTLIGRPCGQPDNLNELYHILYQPRMAALADALADFDVPELELLRQPLGAPRASSKLKNWIDLLHAIVIILSPN